MAKSKRPVKISICCGGGIFTTSVVTDEVHDLLKKKGIAHQITPQKITEIPTLTGADIIIATGKTKAVNKEGTPVLIGLPMFTGVGKEEFSEELLAKIDEVLG